MDDLGSTATRTPWHLWAVGALSLLWNRFGGYDYVMTRMGNMAYLDAVTGGNGRVALDWVERMPMLAQVLWPLGVWASVLGSVLLLLRSRHAAAAFAVSLLGAAGSFAMQFSSQIPPELDNIAGRVMPLVIVALVALQWWYARRQTAAGVLR